MTPGGAAVEAEDVEALETVAEEVSAADVVGAVEGLVTEVGEETAEAVVVAQRTVAAWVISLARRRPFKAALVVTNTLHPMRSYVP